MLISNVENLRVLVVDDDDFILDIVAINLESIGMNHVTLASNGQQALSKLDGAQELFDLILCDLNMPEMDGVEFLRHLSQREFDGDIILLSGEEHSLLKITETLAKSHHLNVLGALDKPMVIDDFKALLLKHKERDAVFSDSSTDKKIEIEVDEIRIGIEKRQFLYYYQPQVLMETKKLVGLESLARWNHPKHGILSPYYFIAMAENNHLIAELTYQLIETAMQQAKDWQLTQTDITLSLNLSATMLDRLDMPELFEQKVKQYGLSTKNFIFEITESQIIEHMKVATEIITRLRLKGFGLSIDDFGTGYSSMEQLQQLPFTELKIDRAFVNDIQDKPVAKAILESSADLAKKLGVKSVAEGIETIEDWDIACSSNCDIAQGYLISKPVPAARISFGGAYNIH